MSLYGGGYPSPTPSQMAPAVQQQQQPYMTAAGQITPGTITYTTTTDANGHVTYHPFRAEPASYQTPQGVVHGIQWVPAQATQVLPAGAQPATSDFTASWKRGYAAPEDRALKDWQRDEEKRRKREEKESAKRVAAWDKERREREKAEEKELRKAREKDAMRDRELGPGGDRRVSSSPYPAYDRASTADVERRMGDMDLGYQRERKVSSSGGYGAGRTRKISISEPERPIRSRAVSGNLGGAPTPYAGGNAYAAGSQYPPAGGYPSAPVAAFPAAGGYAGSGPYGQAGAQYPPGTYPPSPGRSDPAGYSSTYPSAAGGVYMPSSPRLGGGSDPAYSRNSPYAGSGALPGVYPRGHIMEGQPILGGNRSRAPSPAIGGGYGGAVAFPTSNPLGNGPSPRVSPGIGAGALTNYQPEQGMLTAPEGFSRPPNSAQPYTPFDTIKIQDLDDFLDELPRMPSVLVPHDVYHEDWVRLMKDVSLVWAGRLPVPEYPRGRTPKRSTLAADLIELWNSSFFLRRGVEMLLYKGRECRSGPGAGRPSSRLPRLADSSDSLSSSSVSSDSYDSGEDRASHPTHYGGAYGRYGEGQDRWAAEAEAARRERRQRKAEKRRRAKEKKQKRKERGRKYTLYLACVPPQRDY